MMRFIMFMLIFLISLHDSAGQTKSHGVPDSIDITQKYLFYLHGGIVQEKGVNAVSEYYGPYEYLDILGILQNHGFRVISEARPKGTIVEEYAEKVAGQIDTLLKKGVPAKNIVIVGASLGAYITIEVAHILKNTSIKYAVLGLCSEYTVDYYAKYSGELCGNFLSIYESTDEKGSCEGLLRDPECKTGFKEIRLEMGIGHGFLYKPYDEWMLPLVEWTEKG